PTHLRRPDRTGRLGGGAGEGPRAAGLRRRLADGAGDRRQHRRGADRLPQPRLDGAAAARADRAEDGGRVVIAGLIPAAGHSRRMGRPKLALPLLGRPLLAHVVTALREGGADPVLVVLGPHVAEL